MAKNDKTASQKARPAISPEAKEKQMISLAVECAEEQMRERKASSQIVTHYLKLGTSLCELEREKLRLENELLVAKTEAIKSGQRLEELTAEAIKSFRIYSGDREAEDD